MSEWDERIRAHRVWGLLESVGPSIDKALDRDSLPVETISALERIRAVLASCGKRLASADPILVHPPVVENIARLLEPIRTSLDAFASTGDVVQLNTANAHADGLVSQFVSIPGPATVDDLTALSEAASSYRATLENQLREALEAQQRLSGKAQANDQRIVAIETTLAAEQQRLAALINDYQSQHSAAQDKRASEFAAAQNEQLTRFTNAFTELQAQFSGDQNVRNTAFSEFQRTSSDKLAALLTDASTQLSDHDKHYAEVLADASKAFTGRLEELQKGYTDKASEILGLIEKNKKDVESLVGVIGNLGVTSGYQKTANRAKLMLYFWQFVTSIALVGLIAVALLTAFPGVGEKLFGAGANTKAAVAYAQASKITAGEGTGKSTETTRAEAGMGTAAVSEPISDLAFYHGLATRIFLAITFGIFAGYAGRQASHFLDIEKKNRKLALELQALGPFIEPLSPDERSKFRIQVGERSFGVPNDEWPKQKGNDPVTALDLLKSKDFREFFADLVNKEKGKQ